MKTATLDEQSEALRRTIAERRHRLDTALVTLSRVGTEHLTLGGRLARNPWPWLLCACAAGAFLGLDRLERPSR